MTSRKSCEQGLITKNCIVTHTNSFYNFKTALYSSAIKVLIAVESCFNYEAEGGPSFKCVAMHLPTYFYKLSALSFG